MIYVAVILVVIIALVYGIITTRRVDDTISFEESFNKVGLPVIQLFNDSYPLNFLVDTGSDDNFIDTNVLKYIHYTESDEKPRGVICASGQTESKSIFVCINDLEDCATEKFYTLDMSSMNKEHAGMHINGILGSRFCNDAGLVIDYSNKTIFTK